MKKIALFLLLTSSLYFSCQQEKTPDSLSTVTLILGAYTVPKEAYEKEIIPAFQKYWLEKTGQKVLFQESYIASGAQSRAIAAGFEADIAALSLAGDVERLRAAGLITHDWTDTKYKGMVTRSVVAVAVREDNPKNLQDWLAYKNKK